ncbi:hypothetical protein FRB97_001967 [Tulasnella sp. 331]|nr:hypothetical protein FRB97_001967 [Tulasnella sp. 331]
MTSSWEAFKTQLLMDGNNDTSTVSFIATKTDEIYCNEIVTTLNLEDDPDLEEIEERIDQLRQEERRKKRLKTDTEGEAKSICPKLKETRAMVLEYKAHLRALKRGEPFELKLTGNKANKKDATAGKAKIGTKRKSAGGESPKAKRRKSRFARNLSSFGDDFRSGSDDDQSMKFDSHSDDDRDVKADGYEDSNDDGRCDKEDSDYEVAAIAVDVDELLEDEEMEEEVTQDRIKAKLEPTGAEYQRMKRRKKEGKDTGGELLSLKKKLAKAQRDENGLNLNVEMCLSMTKSIAQNVDQSPPAEFEKRKINDVKDIVSEIQETAAVSKESWRSRRPT